MGGKGAFRNILGLKPPLTTGEAEELRPSFRNGGIVNKRRYKVQPTVLSNYKVGVLYNDGYVSLVNHNTIQEACAEMKALMVSFHTCPAAWKNIINIWIEPRRDYV